MLRAAGSEGQAKCSWIDSANADVEEIGWNCFGDGSCNNNNEEEGSDEKVGQYVSIFTSVFM